MRSDVFYQQLLDQGFGPFTGVPCSILKELITCIEQAEDSTYYIATSEGEAMGIAGGLALAGRLPVVLMQNDGYGNAVNPLSSLQLLYKLPALLIITWRAEPGGKSDAVQHLIMGRTLLDLLKIFNIPYQILEANEDNTGDYLANARAFMEREKKPYALIVRRGFFDPEPSSGSGSDPSHPLRINYIQVLAEEARASSIILGTTGYTGRELKQVIDRPGTFYTAGSMGCIGSVGLGIATQCPDRKVYVLDGDGALLMKMGTLATIGLYQMPNLVHIVFDNGQYESTGGQLTASSAVDFPGLALNSGYRYAMSVDTLDEFRDFLKKSANTSGPAMCRVKVQPGTLPDLERPSDSPEQLRDQFRAFLADK
ncbi:MAG: phosphonopyruvate decarboxylase [Fidelibacterota bacterium]|nr:MAG: phosphonopyruvate decarboxylase [Candidatus Neomarinimicrobiota bacterium]